MEEEDKIPIRKSLDDLLKDDNNTESTSSGLPAFSHNEPMDYEQVKSSSMNTSKKLMNSLLKFYLSEELIQKNEYIQLKAKIDVMTMSQLLFQMQTAEHAITTLLRSIDAGEVSPRMFEVLGGLQKTVLDIMKHQTLHMMAAEENMKKLKRDIDIYGSTTTIQIEEKNQAGSIKRGTRNLMREIQAELGNEDIEDATDFDAEDQTEI
jgi:hypothetical protein